MGKYIDLTGQKFGRLTVLRPTGEHYRETSWYTWECLCDCGNTVIVPGTALKSGHTKSCGCLQKDVVAETGRGCARDLTGQVFGYLKALYPTDKRIGSNVAWKCKCLNCGSEVEVASSNLISGNSQSCGCLTSIGETNIKCLLNSNNITYISQKTFENFKTENNCYYKYDFYLPDYNRLIEFDGEQHFKYTGYDWNTKENFEKTQIRDKIKNEYALNNDIPLIRIPYWERDNITLEMILGDKYLIKGE